MDYKTFHAEFELLVCLAACSLTTEEFAAEIERLRTLGTTLDPASDRPRAARLVARLDHAIAPEQTTSTTHRDLTPPPAPDHFTEPSVRPSPAILGAMDFATYKQDEQRLADAVMAKSIGEEDLWIEVDRLRGLVPRVEPEADRERAERSLRSLERVLNVKSPPMSDEMAAAIRVQSKAFLSNGTPAERIDLLEAAMAEIYRISTTVEGAEASRIHHLSEPLAMDIEAIRIHNDPTHPGYQGRRE